MLSVMIVSYSHYLGFVFHILCITSNIFKFEVQYQSSNLPLKVSNVHQSHIFVIKLYKIVTIKFFCVTEDIYPNKYRMDKLVLESIVGPQFTD